MPSPALTLDGRQVLAYRIGAQQLDRDPHAPADTFEECAVLDLGVQDTGADGAAWALATRGFRVEPEDLDASPDAALALVWTLRGAPHVYRRRDLAAVRTAVAPTSEADAAKRVLTAAPPLRAADVGVLDALNRVAGEMRRLVVEPVRKGDLSGAVSAALPAPYLKDCAPCRATHVHEMPFRLAALFAALELEPGSSPPLLRRIEGLEPTTVPPDEAVDTGAGPPVDPALDPVRGYLRLVGPATVAAVAAHLDSTTADVRRRWPTDVVDVTVDGRRCSALAETVDALAAAAPRPGIRLLGPHDPLVPLRDREIVEPDPGRHKALWPAINRPGVVLHDGAVAGIWRPRSSGGSLRIAVQLWSDGPAARAGVAAEAERLAAFRGLRPGGVEVS